jgi:putative tryptophan/tyrosine transport system substrate-binding protein
LVTCCVRLRRVTLNNRRAFLAVLGGSILAGPRVFEAQQGGKVYRLGVLTPGVRPAQSSPWVTANFLPVILNELGYVDGKNLVIEQRFADGKLDRLPGLARELVQLQVDALVAASPPAIRAAKDATRTIPIVMLLSYSDPVELGFVASFGRPGGNITGVVLAAEPTMAGKRLELLKAVVPRAARIAMLASGEGQSRTQVQWAEKVAPSLGVRLVVVEVRNGDYDRAFATMVAERANALCVVASVILSTDVGRIIQLATKHRLPAMYEWREHAEAGGLVAYGGSVSEFTRRAAMYVDRIFKGAHPASLPVERATTFELVVNLKTAKALGLTIPQSFLLRADQVIE